MNERRVTSLTVSMVHRLWQAKWSKRAIGKELGCAVATVRKIIRGDYEHLNEKRRTGT